MLSVSTDTYRTIRTAVSDGIYKAKGSKFLAFAYPIDHVDQVKPLLEILRAEYYDARHHCFAYRLGLSGEQWRAVDDGEPSGTAGRPIHGQLLSAQLTNILVVVVRYFGGTKLGVSGLINAYKEATVDVLSRAIVVCKTIDVDYELQFNYVSMNEVMRIIRDFDARILWQTCDNLCQLRLSLRSDNAGMFYEKSIKIQGLNIEKL